MSVNYPCESSSSSTRKPAHVGRVRTRESQSNKEERSLTNSGPSAQPRDTHHSPVCRVLFLCNNYESNPLHRNKKWTWRQGSPRREGLYRVGPVGERSQATSRKQEDSAVLNLHRREGNQILPWGANALETQLGLNPGAFMLPILKLKLEN